MLIHSWMILRRRHTVGSDTVLRSKLTWFFCGGRNLLDFSVGIEIGLVFVRGVEIDLVFVCGPKIVFSKGVDWLVFCVGGRKRLVFCVRSVVVRGHPRYISGFPMGIWILGWNGCCSLLLGILPTVVLLGGSWELFRPNAMVPLCGSFFFQRLNPPPKDQDYDFMCNISAYGEKN